MNEPTRTRSARFAAMAGAYLLGTFNDNFYKQAVLILAVEAGDSDGQGLALSIFTLPYLVLAAPAGWVADRFSKGKVIICAKGVECAAMLLGGLALCTGHWGLMLVMLGVMGAQASFFSPALNGSIPEVFPERLVPKANGIVRLAVTVAILAGVALAGFAQDWEGTGPLGLAYGRLLPGAGVAGVALAGFAVSLWALRLPAANPRAPFPWTGPLVTLRDFAAIRRDPWLARAVGADVFIWFAGSLQILLLNPLGIHQLGLSKTWTSALIAGQMLGLGLGGLLSVRLTRQGPWHRLLAGSSACMGTALCALPAVVRLPEPLRLPAVGLTVAAVGVFGGMFLIPVQSFLQIRPEPARRGAVLAAVNFAVFAGILLSGPLSAVLNARLLPATGLAAVGVLALAASLALGRAKPDG